MKKAEQSYQNFIKALSALERSLATPPVEERDYAGIIQSFEFTYELTWKTLKIILESNGVSAPFPRIVFEEAFKRQMIEGNEIWKDIIEARNLSTHTCDQALAVKLVKDIHEKYLNIFLQSATKIKTFL